MNTKILVTGANGLVGKALLQHAVQNGWSSHFVAAVQQAGKAGPWFKENGIALLPFDFAQPESYGSYLDQFHTIFLLRPPALTSVPKYFEPLVAAAKEAGVKHIVFLSVQGAGDNSLIPHYKIEQLLITSGLAYTFLRPAYFMQNFLTSLNKQLVQQQLISLPAGKASFTLVDVQDVGAAAAIICANANEHAGQAYDLTNEELLSFGDMAPQLSQVLGKPITYRSPSLIRFYFEQRKLGVSPVFIAVMVMLHYLPRFKAAPPVSASLAELLGRPAGSFKAFVERERGRLRG